MTYRAGVSGCQYPGQLQYRVVNPRGAGVFFDKAFSQPLGGAALRPGTLVCGTPKADPSGMSSYVVEVANGYVSALDLDQLTSAAPSPVLASGEFAGWDLFHDVFGSKDPFHGRHQEAHWQHHHDEAERREQHRQERERHFAGLGFGDDEYAGYDDDEDDYVGSDPVGAFRAGYEAALGYGMDPVGAFRAGVGPCQFPGQLQYRVVSPHGASVFFDKGFSQPLSVPALHPGALICGTPKTDPSGMSSYVVEVDNGYVSALDLQQLTSAAPSPMLRGYFTGADPHLEEERRRAGHHEEHRDHHEEHRDHHEEHHDEHRDRGFGGANDRCMKKAQHAGVNVLAAMLNPFAAIATSQGIKECHEHRGHRVGYSDYRSGFSDYAGYHVGAAAAAHEHGAAASTAPPAAQAALHAQNAQAQAQSAHAAAAHPTADGSAASKAAKVATSHAQKAQDHAHAASTAQHPATAAHHANQAAVHAHAAAAHARGAHAEMHGARGKTPTARAEKGHAREAHGAHAFGRGGRGGFGRGRGVGRALGRGHGFERGYGRFGRHGFSRGWGRGYGRAWRSWSGHEWGWAHPEWRHHGHPAWRMMREDLMGYNAECALRNDWGICLKEIIMTPGGATTFRITPAGVQEDIELEQDEQSANDTAASQGETVVSTDDGLVQGSEQESDGSKSPPEKDAAADGSDASAADQGDAGDDATASADDTTEDGGGDVNSTSAQGDFAGWQDPFTDPYGYLNPYMPSAWDSHYMYYPYYYEHPYYWPTPQTGPYPQPSPYREGPHPHVGIQSGPAIVGWDGWQQHHHHEYPGYGFGGWGWGHGF